MRSSRNNRPGLLGTMARTAVIAGTATAVSGAVHSSQQQKAQQKATAQQAAIDQAAAQQLAAQQAAAAQAAAAQAAAPPPASGGLTDDKIVQLQKLAELQQSGILTEAEFAELKAKILLG
jgi:hypothetical protein